MKTKICPICDKVFPWNKNNVCSTCRTAYRRWINRNRAYDYLGGKCKKCSQNDYDILTCHHKDKTLKDFSLSEKWHSKSWEELKQELDKCILLCFNCHMKLHSITNQKQLKLIQDYYLQKTISVV